MSNTADRQLASATDYDYQPGDAAISSDGKYAAFVGFGFGNLPAGGDPTNDVENIYLENLQTGNIALVTDAVNGEVANAGSGEIALAQDGQEVFFASEATNLVNVDFNYPPIDQLNHTYVFYPTFQSNAAADAYSNLYEYDAVTGTTKLLAEPDTTKVGDNNTDGDLYSIISSVGATSDGNEVAYQYLHSPMVYGAPQSNVIVDDTTNNSVIFSTPASESASRPTLSADGNWLAYEVIGSFGRYTSDVYLQNLFTGENVLVSKAADGTPASQLGPPTDYDSGAFSPVLSADGSALYFASNTNLTADATSGGIYKYETADGSLELIVPISGADGSSDVHWVFNDDESGSLDGISVSADGRYVAVGGHGPVVVSEVDDDNGQIDEPNGLNGFVYDSLTGKVVSALSTTNQFPQLSADGHYMIVTDGSTLTLTDLFPPSVSVDALNDGRAVNAAEIAAIELSGLVITGETTNVEAGNDVSVSLNGITATGLVQADGTWSAMLDASVAKTLTDGGNYTLTASTGDNSGTVADIPIAVTIDTTPPSEFVNGLTIAGDNIITPDDQLDSDRTILVGLTTSAPLAAGDQIVVVSDGKTYIAEAGTGVEYGVYIPTPDRFGGIQAYVEDAAGNQSSTYTQPFTLDPVSTLASTGPNGPGENLREGNANGSFDAVISADGTHVVFESTAPNLTPGATDESISLYEKDLITGAVTLIATGQQPADATYNNQPDYYEPSVDGDGGEVAYTIGAPPSPNGNNPDYYNIEVYTAGQGSVAVGQSGSDPVISTDGNELTYTGPATNEKFVLNSQGDYDYSFVPAANYNINTNPGQTAPAVILASKIGGIWFETMGSSSFTSPIYAKDGTEIASAPAGNLPVGTYENGYLAVRSDGYVQTAFDQINYNQGDIAYTYTPAGPLQLPSDGVNDSTVDGISADGNIILFDSSSKALPGANGRDQAYEYNISTGAVTLVSSGPNGPSVYNIADPSMSSDGRYVVFEADPSTNLSSEDAYGFGTVYVKDTQTGALQAIAENASLSEQAISADGRFVTYDSSGFIEVADLQAPQISIGTDESILFDISYAYAFMVQAPSYFLNASNINAAEQNAPGSDLVIAGNTNLPIGTLVTVSFNGHTYQGIEQAIVDAQGPTGRFNYDVDIPSADIAALADGSYVATASVTDAAGRTATASITYVVDTKPPATPVLIGLTAATDTGSSQTDGITSNPNPVFFGTGEAGSDVQIYENGVDFEVGEAIVDQNGNFTIQTSTLAPGVHTFVASATDEVFNNSGGSAPIQVTIETQAPSAGTSAAESNTAASATSVIYDVKLAATNSLGLADFTLTAAGTAAGTITTVTGSGTDYDVTVSGITGGGSLAVGFAPAAEITDIAGNLETLTSTAHTVDIPPPAPTLYGSGQSIETNQADIDLAGLAPAAGDTVTVFDGMAVVGLYTVGSSDDLYYDIADDNLTEGTHVFTAVTTDPATGLVSASSDAYTVTVDFTPPSETVQSLTIDGNNAISLDDQRNLPTITIAGTLSAPLAAGDTVVVTLNGDSEDATPSQDGRGFSVQMTTPGVGGTVSAYIEDQAGNTTAITTQNFTAAAALDLKLITATPGDQGQTQGSEPTISGDGTTVAFVAQQGFSYFLFPIAGNLPTPPAPFNSGIYVDQLATGIVSLAAAGANSPSFSGDGTILAYIGHDPTTYVNEVYLQNLANPGSAPILVTADADGAPDSYYSSGPNLSGDGTELVFSSSSQTLGGRSDPQTQQKIFLADIANGAVSDVRLIAGDDTGYSSDAHVSEDGSVLTFISTDTDLVAGASSGDYEVYAEALRGPNAGAITLVSALPDGTAANDGAYDPSISADGRYVVFDSTDTGLTPDNLGLGQTLSGGSEVFVKDLQTGELSLISTTASGVLADGDSSASQISGNGEFVGFTSDADNLGANSQGTEQAYVKDIVTGQVTLVSEPGGVPGDQNSSQVSLSDDGSRVVFSSDANNLVANDQNNGSDVFVADTTTAPDTTPPTVTVPQSIMVAATSSAGAIVNFSATATDPVDGTDPVMFSQASGSLFAIGTTTVIASATDNAGNTGTASFKVTVADTIAPTVMVPQSITVAATSAAGAIVTFGATATDPVDGTEPVTFSQSSGSEFAIGTTTVNASATDKAGNKGTASFTVTVTDTTAPTLTVPQPITVAATSAAGAVVTFGATATDPVDGTEPVTFSQSSGSEFAIGTTTVNASATDKAGNKGTASFTVTVTDTTAPTLTVPQPITVAATSAAGAVVTFGATATDPVDGTEPVTFSQSSGSEFAIGTTTVNASATDKAGNKGTASFTVTVTDTTAPTLTVPQPITVEATSPAGAHVSFTATATDPVDGTDPVTFSQASGSEFAIGTTIVTATATDTAGNKGTASFKVTVDPLSHGIAEDGYIVGGTVGYDDGTGHINQNEPTTLTDAHGNFSLGGGTGSYVMIGGTDSATGLAFNGTFEAPAGSIVISPLTTLVEAVVTASGDSTTAANAVVDKALGLPANTDLTALDVVAGTINGNATATAAFEAGSDILNAVTLIASAGGSAVHAYTALAATVTSAVNAGITVDLTDSTTIESVAESAGLDTTAASSVASVVSTTHPALEQQLNGATPLQTFEYITGASIAEQGDAASSFAAAPGDTSDAVMQYMQNFNTILGSDDMTAADHAPCYCPGTLISTDRGAIAVEQLSIGDLVLTLSGAARPIKWIGRRAYSGRFVMGRADILPICLKAGSLSDGLPRRDLWISPHHAMYLEGVLIEARDLVNHVSIVQADHVEKVEYIHIELHSHDIIFAEGSHSESFLDNDSRTLFHNAHEYDALYGDAAPARPRFYAPRRSDGYEVEAARRIIDTRAGLKPAHHIGAALRGHVDVISTARIAGWAQNPDHPEAPVCLDIFAGGRLIGQVLASRYRKDLERAGLGSGRHSFDFTPGRGMDFDHTTVEVRRSLDQHVLPMPRVA